MRVKEQIIGMYGNITEEEEQKLKELEEIIDKTRELRIPQEIKATIEADGRGASDIVIEMGFRMEYIREFGYIKLEDNWITPLTKYLKGKKCLEVMAGKGYLSAILKERGINIVATDIIGNEKVESLEALESIIKYKDVEIIIMSWVDYGNPIGYEVLKLKREINPKAKIILIGEGKSGCCGTDSLFELLEVVEDKDFKEIQERYRRWSAIWDTVRLIK